MKAHTEPRRIQAKDSVLCSIKLRSVKYEGIQAEDDLNSVDEGASTTSANISVPASATDSANCEKKVEVQEPTQRDAHLYTYLTQSNRCNGVALSWVICLATEDNNRVQHTLAN